MSNSADDQQEYQRLRGEYLDLAASLEYTMTWVIAYKLELGEHKEFLPWFTGAPIPMPAKVQLFGRLFGDDCGIVGYENLADRIRETWRVRNTLAHSFREFDRVRTSRGPVPEEIGSIGVLRSKLEELRKIESLIGGLLYDYITGPIEPVFTDDYADWPP